MKRSQFARATFTPALRAPLKLGQHAPRHVRMSSGSVSPEIPKTKPVRDEAYRRLVAGLACINCRRPPPSQCAHSDSLSDGKGLSRKACDLATFPLCADAPGWRGCHTLFDQGGLFTKETRHVKTAQWIAETRAALA